MGNSEPAAVKIYRLTTEQDRTIAWLSRQSGVPYKRLLAEVLHQSRPLSLETALCAAKALGIDLTDLVTLEKENAAA